MRVPVRSSGIHVARLVAGIFLRGGEFFLSSRGSAWTASRPPRPTSQVLGIGAVKELPELLGELWIGFPSAVGLLRENNIRASVPITSFMGGLR
jgi:hypothetical protein